MISVVHLAKYQTCLESVDFGIQVKLRAATELLCLRRLLTIF